MTTAIWKVLDESKEGKDYLPSEQQFNNLVSILSKQDKVTVQKLEKEFNELRRAVQGNEFEKLHVEDGGFVSSGDDGFYMDFLSWLVAQGQDLFIAFKQEGAKAVEDYIRKHNIPRKDYMYECMAYAFHDFVD